MNRRRQRMLDVGLRLNLGRYRLLVVALSPYMLGYTIWRSSRDGGWRYLWQRLGFAYPRPWGRLRPVWLHCASVGELNAALPLVRLLRERRPDQPLLVTTNTPTASAVLQRQALEGVTHAYLPLDLAGPVELFVRRYRPRCGLILETELWANLYNACANREVPLVLINARLSDRTLGANAWLKAGYQVCFGALSRILARSEADAAGYRTLGASDEQVETIGNIKFAGAGDEPVEPLLAGRYVLAVSTHDDEELRLARIWAELGADDCVLVIAPRHPERRESIRRQLADIGLPLVLRSESGQLPDAGIYLADTLGEMPGLLAGAALVFVGGSLIERGGQNPLEAARAGRAILCGPNMQNFVAELELLQQANAIVAVRDDQELREQLQTLLSRPRRIDELGARAAAAVTGQAGIAGTYFDRLVELDLV